MDTLVDILHWNLKKRIERPLFYNIEREETEGISKRELKVTKYGYNFLRSKLHESQKEN